MLMATERTGIALQQVRKVSAAENEARPSDGNPLLFAGQAVTAVLLVLGTVCFKDEGAGQAKSASRFGSGGSPVPFHAVATEATILVSTGGARPIRLGDQLPYDASGTIHVWDWSKSAVSRPLKVTCKTGMAVSPAGKWIVT